MSDWIEWNDRPSDDSTVEVEVEYRDGTKNFGAAAEFDWKVDGGPLDIVRFRVVARPKRNPVERLAALERRVEELERKQSVRVVAPAPIWVPAVSPPYTGEPYTVGETHPSVPPVV